MRFHCYGKALSTVIARRLDHQPQARLRSPAIAPGYWPTSSGVMYGAADRLGIFRRENRRRTCTWRASTGTPERVFSDQLVSEPLLCVVVSGLCP
jgi:hypothetical protein